MPFSDVVRQRDGSAPNLACQLELLESRQSPAHAVHRLAKLPRCLVSLQVLERLVSFALSVHISSQCNSCNSCNPCNLCNLCNDATHVTPVTVLLISPHQNSTRRSEEHTSELQS